MGLVYRGVPTSLVLELINAFDIQYFVETGTYMGSTALWASENFRSVITIEGSLSIWQKTRERYGHIKNVQFLYGDSRQKLKEVVENLESPAIFWLDAHWSGGNTYGEGNECPVLEELQAIGNSSIEHLILIDDAHLFLSPPPLPHLPEQWPDIVSIINLLNSEQSRHIVVIEDVIVAVPGFAKPLLTKYCQEVNTEVDIRQQSKRVSFINTLKGLRRSFMRVRLR